MPNTNHNESHRDRPLPNLDGLDDPWGIRSEMPDDLPDGETEDYFINRVQEIRWELHALWGDLDVRRGCTAATEMLLPQVVDLLGVVARSEAAYLDDPAADLGHRIFAQDVGRPGKAEAGAER